MSWLLKTYVCKDDGAFTGIQGVVTDVHEWGKSQVGGWLEEGVREAVDALTEAENKRNNRSKHQTYLEKCLNEPTQLLTMLFVN